MLQMFKSLFSSVQVDYKELVQNGAVIIDVRSPQEYQSGHLQKSINIPLDQIQKRIAEIKKMNKPVITVCKSGARSAMAKTWLANASITVYNGGSWNSLSGKI
ncbi:MAG TPA: rhodanese-like domain-containing protein [Chitinophagaceae bacterium]|jgi:rhodanese-related sulfurtransferase|nr:rhodanese-like domain-containing protein [Chitinophagaceae bacterium]HPH24096.1 rhodanese-like domain-containing protein [Chitinophagaceae bacterium]